MNLMELGARIRGRREKQGLEQADLAAATRVSPQAVSKWERGENAPDISVLATLAGLLDVSVEWLLTGGPAERETFEAVVFATALDGFAARAEATTPSALAAWVNGLHLTVTEAVRGFDGVPVKYVGDGFLAFFAGADRHDRAVQAALRARDLVDRAGLRIALASGPVFLGRLGHPDCAAPDITAAAEASSLRDSGSAAPRAYSSRLRRAGPGIFAFRGETLEDYWRLLDSALTWPDGAGPDLLVDDGGDATWYLFEGADPSAATDEEGEDERAGRRRIEAKRAEAPGWFEAAAERLIGLSEETTTGVRRLEARDEHRGLRCAAVNVNDSVTKSKFDNVYGCRESLVDAIKRATDLMIGGRRAVVCGFGDVGKGSAEALAAHRARVFVTEADPICALQAAMAGHEVVRLEAEVERADIFVTATGDKGVIRLEHLRRMKDGAVVCNIGHFDHEVDVRGLDAAPDIRKEPISPGLDRYRFEDGRAIYVLAEGRLVNLGCANGHPAFVMSMSFTNQALAQLDLWQRQPAPGLYRLPKALDEEVARLHLPALGAELTPLAPGQAAYLGVAVEGPYKPDHYGH